MTRHKRTIIGFLLVAAIAAGAGFLAPEVVKAQGGVVTVTDILMDNADRIKAAEDQAKKKMLNSLDYAITTAMLTAINTTTQRLAQTTATWIASGATGQGALIFSEEFGSYGKKLLLDTASDALNTFSKTFVGFGICDPLDAKISLRVKLGIARVYAPKPSCTWAKLKASGEATYNNFESGKFLQNISASVEMGQSPLAFAVNTQFGVGEKAQKNEANKLAERLSSNGYKNLTDPISGNTKTPAAMIENVTDFQLQKTAKADEMQIQASLEHSALFAEVGANALKVFTSTLISKYIDKYLKKGMVTGLDVVCKLSNGEAFDLCKGKVNEQQAAGLAGTQGASLAAAYFASVFTPTIAAIDDYSPLNELSACPTDPSVRGIWNCTLDQAFVSILSPSNGNYMTLREAIAAGNWNKGAWELVPSTSSVNSDRDCYTKAFCYNNLVKLRRMRIIPAGWEMAAQADASANHQPITLKGAMDLFNTPGSPYYRLVDPDWVLKVPVTQCRQSVPGQTLSAPNSSERADVCVDAPSCIKEDKDGKCVSGFGYCTRERSVWQIDATECPAQYASCNTYSDPAGKQLSILDNTVDAAACNADNAGCKPYALASSNSVWSIAPAVYLSRKAPTCDVANAGCRPLEQTKDASTRNVLPNPSFETPNADNSMASSWTKDWEGQAGNASQYLRDGAFAQDGYASYLNAGILSLGGYHNLNGTVDIEIEPNKLYTFSFYAKSTASGAQNGIAEIKLFDQPFVGADDHVCPAYAGIDSTPKPTCVQDLSLAPVQPSCTTTVSAEFIYCATAAGGDYGPKNPSGEIKVVFPLSTGYNRYAVTFATTENSHYFGLYMPVVGAPYYIDSLQLEKGPSATAFHVGGDDKDGAIVKIKTPPDYLGCTGEASDAGKGCNAYAPVCRQSEVGCSSYKPADGGTSIPAVTSANDSCNSKCVGYSTFKQERSIWESAPVFPLYFIPDTAKSCQISEVGCDQFTNLEAAASGGEARAYFTSIRSCRKPDATKDGAYFTWEGSAAGGFQLRSFVLRQMDVSDSALMNVPNGSETFIYKAGAAVGPAYLAGTDALACTRTIFVAKSNPDCRELIDADGNIFYRLLSRTVASTAECKTFRKTISNTVDCAGSGGTWDEATKACDYWVYTAQSRACPAAVNGCRAYTGDQGNNTRAVFTSTFENKQLDGWIGGALSGESTNVGGSSYSLANANTSLMIKPLVGNGANESLVQAGRSYTITLWAKGTGVLFALKQNSLSDTGNRSYFNNINDKDQYRLTTEWQRYVLGPLVAENTIPVPDQVLVIGAYDDPNAKIFADNIELTETQDHAYLVKNTWKTPFICDTTPAGQPLAQAQLNCKEFEDQNGDIMHLRSFDHLCREQAVGCEAFTDKQGTATPFASFFNAAGPVTDALSPDTYTVPADTTRYLVNRDEFHCDTLWCTPLGDKDLNAVAVAGGVTSRVLEKVNSKTVYRVVDPAKIGGQLCAQSAVACESWSGANGTVKYFKDPGTALCEYRDKQTVSGVDSSGWFKRGTKDEPCDPSFVATGSQYGIWKNGDPKFAGFAGACKQEYSACAEFVDRSDTALNANGRAFYYIRDNQIDDAQSECNKLGGVSQKQGCVLLDETANPRKTANTAATNEASAKAGSAFVAPIAGAGGVGNDANIVLKVGRDRVCTEWLECNTEQVVTSGTGRDATRCLSLGSCIEKGADGRCASWGKISQGGDANDVLTAAIYAAHADPAFAYNVRGSDYSGFSIPGKPPVDTMKQIQPSQTLNNFVLQAAGKNIASPSCKVFPEADAPFPTTVLVDQRLGVKSARKSSFANVNVCEGGDCECSYRKVTYSTNQAKYFPETAETGILPSGEPGPIKPAVCIGGPYDKEECAVLANGNRSATNPSCVNGNQEGTCAPIEKIDSALGEKGYCLEYDNTLKVNGSVNGACITWMPIDSAKGRDTANQFTSAAFIPAVGQERYCAAPAKYCVPHDCANPSSIKPLCTRIKAISGFPAPSNSQKGSFVDEYCRNFGHSLAAGTDSQAACVNYCMQNPEKIVGGPIVLAGWKYESISDCLDHGVDGFECRQEYEVFASTQCAKSCTTKLAAYPTAADKLKYISDLFADVTHCDKVIDQDIFCADAGNKDDQYCRDARQACRDHYAEGTRFCTNARPACVSGDPANVACANVLANYCGDQDLTSCATGGSVFCGDTGTCPSGTECVAINNLTVHQTEYTKNELTEGYFRSVPSNSFDLPTEAVQYTNIAELGARTYFGSANRFGIPTASSAALEFKIAPRGASGDWIPINKNNEPKSVSPESKSSGNTKINPYPADLIGLYSFGIKDGNSGTGTVDYDLAKPNLLLLSQIERISIKVLSNSYTGLCQYSPPWCVSYDNNVSDPTECVKKTSEVANTACRRWIGSQDPVNGYLYYFDPTSDLNFSTTGVDYVTLNSANNWQSSISGQALDGTGGDVTFTLKISQDEPKRVLGMNVELTDKKNRGIVYVAALDAHLYGPACGETVYIGSSNPTADTKIVPRALTDAVNGVNDFSSISFVNNERDSFCRPWGAFSATNPPTIVTAASSACELAKGAIYNGISQVRQLFAAAFGGKIFSDKEFKYNINDASGKWDSTPATAKPTVTAATINGQSGSPVFGIGSYRANLKFLAEANSDHMPLKGVAINWGDGTDGVDSGNINYYMNHSSVSVCENGSRVADKFAKTSVACDTNPLSYTHVYAYVCNNPRRASDVFTGSNDLPAGITASTLVCEFTPTISVIDNWGMRSPDTNGSMVVVGPPEGVSSPMPLGVPGGVIPNPPPPAPACGNGVVETGEACDTGLINVCGICSADCKLCAVI